MTSVSGLHLITSDNGKKTERSGTFTDNMTLPIHRWIRFSAGFSAEWAEHILTSSDRSRPALVLDPFLGSGTLALSADKIGIPSIGIEAHPFIARIAKAKLLWDTSATEFGEIAGSVLLRASRMRKEIDTYPELIKKCYTPDSLKSLDALRTAWLDTDRCSPASLLTWFAITSILRPTSTAGTAQWQYILPKKLKKTPTSPFDAFQKQVNLMMSDMRYFQSLTNGSLATVIQGDARDCPDIQDGSVDLVITSPPYANNYDYADATRLEMCFWKEIESWGNLHQAVRGKLIVSSSQHASANKVSLDEILQFDLLAPIREEITEICRTLETERLNHGGMKHYHTMIASYFAGMAKVWEELRRVCRAGATVCFVIGDSAPYGVYVPVERWLGELARYVGFYEYRFERIRDRNIKWKNRKHRVPLHEGILWVQG